MVTAEVIEHALDAEPVSNRERHLTRPGLVMRTGGPNGR